VTRPFAFSIISSRRSQLPPMSISVKETPFHFSSDFAEAQ